MQLIEPAIFVSKLDPGKSLTFVHLNAGAPTTVLYCYGGGGASVNTNLYLDYTLQHQELSIICIDRWCRGCAGSPSRSWLADLSRISYELLQSLGIASISITAHSAGIYQALDFAIKYPIFVKTVFPLCSHIPVQMTGSRMMTLLSKAPKSVVQFVGKLDSLSLPRPLYRFVGDQDEDSTQETIVTKERRALVKGRVLSAEDQQRYEQNRSIDYELVFEKLPDVSGEFLLGLYTSCKVKLIWLTTTRDTFFGPDIARSVLQMSRNPESQVVECNTAAHSNIFHRRETWDLIRKLSGSTS